MSTLIVVCMVLVYFLPTIIAMRREHHSMYAIAFVNTALGWTGIGWLWALIWSLTGTRRS